MPRFLKVKTRNKHQADCILNIDQVTWVDIRNREVTFCNGKSLVIEAGDFNGLLEVMGFPVHKKALPGPIGQGDL